MKQVENYEHFTQLLDQGVTDFAIALNFGLKSSKHITWDGEDTFFIHNLIDDTYQEASKEQLFDTSYTNIGKALKCGALYYEK